MRAPGGSHLRPILDRPLPPFAEWPAADALRAWLAAHAPHVATRLWTDTVPYTRPIVVDDHDPVVAPDRADTPLAAAPPGSNGVLRASDPVSPTFAQEVTYLNGLNPDGTVSAASFWGMNDSSARKYGAPTAGTGATISYAFDAAAAFTATERATFLKAFAMWESVANVHFVAAVSAAAADVLLMRGASGGDYESGDTYLGSGSTLGSPAAQAVISIQTSQAGFDLSGSFDVVGGYGLSAVIHEVGHLLGLGHAGAYNGAVTPSTDQFSAYDERLYSTMSYIYYGSTSPKYAGSYPITGTDWGITADGYRRQAPHTVGMLDIAAVQQLYGTPTGGPLTGGQVFGFNTNLTGALRDFFDFTVNTHPVVTLYDQGTGNTLDLSGFAQGQTIDLNAGSFSSVGGLTNNLAIAPGTQINRAIGGSGNDLFRANPNGDTIAGGGGFDTVSFAAASAGVTVSLALTGAQLSGGAGSVALSGIEALIGSTYADTLTGDAGDNMLDGGGGADTLRGAAGNDSYVVNDPGVTVIENAGEGTDTVTTSLASYALPANVERLVYTGTAASTLTGNAADNDVTGGDGKDFFDLRQGGDDVAAGGAGNDLFFFGASFTAADRVDGGGDADQLGLQGDYTGVHALTLGATQLVNVETVVALPGYSYGIALQDSLIATGKTMTFYAAELAAGQSFTFDGHLETDGKIVTYGGLGADTITGGALNDAFYFGRDRFDQTIDRVDGGGGTDQLALDGSYTLTIDPTRVLNIETLVLLDGTAGSPALYTVTLGDGWATGTQTKTIYLAEVRSGATVDGSAESSASFTVFGGKGDDVLKGGAGADILYGGPGADTLTGGAGADSYRYIAAAHSIGSAHDIIIGFDANADTIDLPFGVSGLDVAVAGAASGASLDDQLTAALGSLGAYHAVQFTAGPGALAGHVFEVIDANGTPGYQAGQDMVIELQGTIHPIITTAPFV